MWPNATLPNPTLPNKTLPSETLPSETLPSETLTEANVPSRTNVTRNTIERMASFGEQARDVVSRLLNPPTPGTEAIPIADLVTPLRYDIVVRADFFAFLDREADLARTDFPRFLERCMHQPYYRFFTSVVTIRNRRLHNASGPQIAAAFEERVRKSMALQEAFNTSGFDPSHPVTLRAGRSIDATATGKLVDRIGFPADGCHRIALLSMAGQATLAPEQYRIQTTPNLSPIDNTSILVRALGLGPSEYYTYLSRGYTGTAVDERDALVELVARKRPECVDELRQVLASDEPLLGGPALQRPAS